MCLTFLKLDSSFIWSFVALGQDEMLGLYAHSKSVFARQMATAWQVAGGCLPQKIRLSKHLVVWHHP